MIKVTCNRIRVGYPDIEEHVMSWTPQKVLESVAKLHIPTLDTIHRLDPEYISFTSSFYGVTDTVTLEGSEEEMKGIYILLVEFRRLMEGDPNPMAAHAVARIRASSDIRAVFLGETVVLAILLTKTGLDLNDIALFRVETLIAIYDLHLREGVPARELIPLVYG